MYGLKQESITSYNQIISLMEPLGFYPLTFTTELWEHKTRRTKFCGCVDDFGVIFLQKMIQIIF